MRTLEHPTDVRDLAHAYARRMTPGHYFSHVTAALLFSTPLPWRFRNERVVHVSVDRPGRPASGRGVRGHLASSPRAIAEVDGLRVLAAAETWCELGAILDHDELVIAADHLVRRKRRATTMENLKAAVAARGSARHVRALRAALEDVRPGTDSPKETELRLLITHAGLPEPLVHFEVRDAAGDFVATPDLAYPVQKIAIEYEGKHHQSDPEVYADDITRRELLERAGWKVILVISAHLRDHPAWTVERIRTALAERAA